MSAAYENEATILVLNRKDNVLEVATTHHDSWQQALWTVEYSGDHYTPVQRLAPDTLAALCPLFTFQPWIARPGDMKGGSVYLGTCGMINCRMSPKLNLKNRTKPGWKMAQLRHKRR